MRTVLIAAMHIVVAWLIEPVAGLESALNGRSTDEDYSPPAGSQERSLAQSDMATVLEPAMLVRSPVAAANRMPTRSTLSRVTLILIPIDLHTRCRLDELFRRDDAPAGSCKLSGVAYDA
jgi:hypothetical protein